MKKCKHCKNTLPINDFYKTARGYIQSSCKSCMKARAIAWTKSEKGKAYQKTYKKSNPNYAGWTRWRLKNGSKYYKIYRLKNHQKTMARAKLNNAIISGKIQKRNICEMCYSKPTECHHSNYSKPFEFIELCKNCHEILHHQKQTF